MHIGLIIDGMLHFSSIANYTSKETQELKLIPIEKYWVLQFSSIANYIDEEPDELKLIPIAKQKL